MRHILVAILIVVLILSVGLIEQAFVTDTMKSMKEQCDTLITALELNDMKSAKTIVDNLNAYWESHNHLLELFFSHNEFRDVPALMGELNGSIAIGNIEESIVRTYTLRADIENHLNVLSCTYENII